ncbi:MAG: sugar kinase [Pirellulaceae bacterium]
MFLAFGEIMARLAPPGRLRWRQALPGTIEVTWGGGEANVSASLALFGNPVRYVTAMPRQPLAESIAGTLRGLGVDVDHWLWRESGRLGLYFVEVGANQRGSTVVYDRDASAMSLAEPAEYDWNRLLDGVHWLHVTGITPAISENACRSNLELVQRADAAGIQISCDLNFRKKLWRWRPGTKSQQLARECMTQVLQHVDVVIANEEDAADVLGIHAAGTNETQGELNIQGYEQVARDVVRQFPQVGRVAITLRESISADHNNWGGMLYDSLLDQAFFAPRNRAGAYAPYAITDIVDRVGAGDSFAAGLLHALHSETYRDPQQAIQFAVAASCLKHSIQGDFNYVSVADVVGLMAGNASGRVQR